VAGGLPSVRTSRPTTRLAEFFRRFAPRERTIGSPWRRLVRHRPSGGTSLPPDRPRCRGPRDPSVARLISPQLCVESKLMHPARTTPEHAPSRHPPPVTLPQPSPFTLPRPSHPPASVTLAVLSPTARRDELPRCDLLPDIGHDLDQRGAVRGQGLP